MAPTPPLLIPNSIVSINLGESLAWMTTGMRDKLKQKISAAIDASGSTTTIQVVFQRCAGPGGAACWCQYELQPDPNNPGQYVWVQTDSGCPSGGGGTPSPIPVPLITVNLGADLSGMTAGMRSKLKTNISAAIDGSAGGTGSAIQVVFQRCSGPGGAVCWCQYELQPDPNNPGEYVWVQVDSGCP